MFEVNGTLVIFVASFLLFMVLLNEIMLKPVGRAMEKRQDKIQQDLVAGREARQQASSLVENYETQVKRIRSEAHELITTTAQAATKAKSEKMAKIQAEGAKQLEAAKSEIAQERANLIDELVTQEQELVEAITQKVLGEPVAVQLDSSKVRKNLEEAC